MALRPKPNLKQEASVAAWGGTPSHLVAVAEQLRALLPNADCKITVTSQKAGVRETSEPSALSQIRASDRTTRVDIDLHEFRARPGQEESSFPDRDQWALLVWFSEHAVTIITRGPSEVESRVLRDAALEAVNKGQRRYAPLHEKFRRLFLVALATTLVLGAAPATLWALSAPNPVSVFFFAIAVMGPFASFVTVPVLERVLPIFEIYDDKPIVARFRWALVTIVIAPLIISAVAAYAFTR